MASRATRVVTGLFWRRGMTGGAAHGMRWTAATGMRDIRQRRRLQPDRRRQRRRLGPRRLDRHPTYGNRRAAVWGQRHQDHPRRRTGRSEATAVNIAGTVIVGNGPDPLNPVQVQALMWKWNGSSWTTTVIGVMNGRGKTVSPATA